jgi:hypothetical protein
LVNDMIFELLLLCVAGVLGIAYLELRAEG